MSVRVDPQIDHAQPPPPAPAGGDEAEAAPVFLATSAATRSQRRVALGVVIVSALVFAVALPFANAVLAPLAGFIPSIETAHIIVNLVTAVLLLGQVTKLRSLAILVLASGYFFDTLIIVSHLLSFPGVFGPAGAIGGPQAAGWLYVLWHAAFPLFVIAYAILKERPGLTVGKSVPAAAVAAAAFVAVAVGALTLLVTVGQNLLPPLLNGNQGNGAGIYFSGTAWLLSIVAVAILWWRGIRSVLDIWVAAVMCVWVFDVALGSVFTTSRFSVGWYVGRGYGLLAASFVMVVLLLETSGLIGRVVETNVALTRETRRLKADVRERITAQEKVEAQLRQAQKMEAIGNLTGGMAHDFNNLLAVIIGNLDVLCERRTQDPDVQELAGEALYAAVNGADLTKRLLAFARRQPLQPRLVDLNALITGVTRLLGRTLGERIRILLDLSPQVWPSVVDPAQLEAALINLANNARDAMPNGGTLTIISRNGHLDADYASTHPGVVAGDYAGIEVTDTGTGMTPDVVEKAFEPFFTTKPAGKGSGLGLSMVYGFIKQSGGHINIYSEPGIGTTFRLYLPRAQTSEKPKSADAPADDVQGRGETVLAVEDNPSLRRVVVRQLRELGYRVLEAESAATAMAVLNAEPVDVLFTDVVMGRGANGFELAHNATVKWPNIRVLITSGFPDASLNGGDKGDGPPVRGRILTKPYRKEDLARTLRAVLNE